MPSSGQPNERYGYPDELIYVVWAFAMLIPCYFALRGGVPFDRRPNAVFYGMLVGLTGAGGQLLLFQALTVGPAYLIFPVISLSPAITVLMAMVFLREKTNRLGAIGVALALVAIVMFSIGGGGDDVRSTGPWLLLAILICIAWGVQAFFMKKAATVGVNDGSIFGYMTISALALVPVALLTMSESMSGYPWQAPALTAATQVLNAAGALFLVMALSRGKAVIVAPCTNALAPVLTIVLSLIVYSTLPSVYTAIGVVLALVGSTLMVYTEEKRSEAAEPAREEEAERAPALR